MQESYLYLIAVGLFLFITLVVGLMTRKASTMHEYTTAGGKLGGGVLLMTLLATLISERDVFLERAFSKGYVGLARIIATCIVAIALGTYLFPRLIKYKQYTLSGVIGQMYGKRAGFITSLISGITSVCIITGQLCFIREVVPYLIDIDPNYAIATLGILITLYTCIGGLRSVAITDVLQFCFLAFGSLIFTLVCLNHMHQLSPPSEISCLPKSFWANPHVVRHLSKTFFWALWPSVFLMPPVIQRVLLIKNKEDIKHTFIGVSVIYFIFTGLLFWVGIQMGSYYNLLPKDGRHMGKVITLVCQHPVGLLSMILGLLAIMMSTMDSFLNACAIDIVIGIQKRFPKKIKEKEMVKYTRIITFFIGMMSTLLALAINVRKAGTLIGYSYVLFAPIGLLFLASLFGFKENGRVFLSTCCFYFFVAIGSFGILYYYKEATLDFIGRPNMGTEEFQIARTACIISILLSILWFFITHYLAFGEFVRVKENSIFLYEKEIRSSFDLTWLKHPVRWANQKATTYGKAPYLFGLFTYIVFMVPYFTQSNVEVILWLRGIGVLLATLLLLESRWPKSLKPYFNLYYYFTILYAVPFTAIMTTFEDSKGHFMLPSLVLSMILLIVLVDWKSFLGFQAFSLLLAIGMRSLLGKSLLSTDWGSNTPGLLAYTIIYSLVVCLLFARKKQLTSFLEKKKLLKYSDWQTKQLEVQTSVHQQLANSLNERSSTMSAMRHIILELNEALQQRGLEHLSDKVEQLHHGLTYLSNVTHHSLVYLPLNTSQSTLQYLMKKSWKELQENDLFEEQVIFHSIKEDIPLKVDLEYMVKLLIQAIHHQIQEAPKPVHVYSGPTSLNYNVPHHSVPISGYCFIITQEPTPPSFPEVGYQVSEHMPWIPEQAKLLESNRRITAAHYGTMQLDFASHATEQVWSQTYVFPCFLDEVRPKIASFTDEDLEASTQLDTPQDQAFLAQIDQRGKMNKRIIHALKRCKYYHRHQKRKTGEPFYFHPMRVAEILLDYTQEEDIIIAALLHDSIEDTPYHLQQLALEFGADVATIVDEVSHLHSDTGRKVKLDKEELFIQMLGQANQHSLLVKLADRIDNLRTIEGHGSLAKRHFIAKETLAYFIPIAQALGVHVIEKELQKHCNRILKEIGEKGSDVNSSSFLF